MTTSASRLGPFFYNCDAECVNDQTLGAVFLPGPVSAQVTFLVEA